MKNEKEIINNSIKYSHFNWRNYRHIFVFWFERYKDRIIH